MPRYSKSDKLDYMVKLNAGQTYNHADGDEPVAVYGFGTYPASSVLAGQVRRVWMDSFRSIEDALKAYPTAQVEDGLQAMLDDIRQEG